MQEQDLDAALDRRGRGHAPRRGGTRERLGQDGRKGLVLRARRARWHGDLRCGRGVHQRPQPPHLPLPLGGFRSELGGTRAGLHRHGRRLHRGAAPHRRDGQPLVRRMARQPVGLARCLPPRLERGHERIRRSRAAHGHGRRRGRVVELRRRRGRGRQQRLRHGQRDTWFAVSVALRQEDRDGMGWLRSSIRPECSAIVRAPRTCVVVVCARHGGSVRSAP